MKTLLSVLFGALLLLPAALMAAPPAPVQGPAQAPGKSAMQAPAQAPAQAPSKTAQATVPANNGYRTYSYQPAMNGATYGYGGYGPTNIRAPQVNPGFYDAGHKIRGPY